MELPVGANLKVLSDKAKHADVVHVRRAASNLADFLEGEKGRAFGSTCLRQNDLVLVFLINLFFGLGGWILGQEVYAALLEAQHVEPHLVFRDDWTE